MYTVTKIRAPLNVFACTVGKYESDSKPDNLNSAENLNEKKHLHFEFVASFEHVMLVTVIATLRSK